MKEIRDLVKAMSKIIRKQDKDLLAHYLVMMQNGQVNLARIVIDEIQDYYNERKDDSENFARLSRLSDQLYSETMKVYEESI